MEFFTALYIEYSLRGIDIETYLILPDYEACQIAIRDNEDMHKYFNADSDVDMYCIRTNTLSRSIKPKLRASTQSVGHQ
jgi:hypothetical protein